MNFAAAISEWEFDQKEPPLVIIITFVCMLLLVKHEFSNNPMFHQSVTPNVAGLLLIQKKNISIQTISGLLLVRFINAAKIMTYREIYIDGTSCDIF